MESQLLTLSLLAANFAICKQFGPRSEPKGTFKTLIVFRKIVSRRQQNRENLPNIESFKHN